MVSSSCLSRYAIGNERTTLVRTLVWQSIILLIKSETFYVITSVIVLMELFLCLGIRITWFNPYFLVIVLSKNHFHRGQNKGRPVMLTQQPSTHTDSVSAEPFCAQFPDNQGRCLFSRQSILASGLTHFTFPVVFSKLLRLTNSKDWNGSFQPPAGRKQHTL